MTTIRKRISRPYFILLIAIPIAILVLFNVIVAYYSQARAEEDFQAVVNSIAERIQSDDLPNMADLIRNQANSEAEVIVYNRRGELSRIFNQQQSFINEEIAALAYDETETLEHNQMGEFSYVGDTYYVMSVDYESMTLSDKVVYISKGLGITDFVVAVNFVLIGVSTIITLIALFVSRKVTNAIANPIEHLTSLVENMKSDELIMIDDRSDSVELKKLTTEINALNKRIYHYNEAQKSFLHNASHELRTPLMSIQGYADGIEMGVFADAKGTAHLISDQSKRLTKLVDSLLTLARTENFHANKKIDVMNLSDCMVDMLSTYKGYAVNEQIEIAVNIEEGIYVPGNNELFQGSVGNIISNAIRYAKSTVEISLRRAEDHAVITVRDDGDGIANIDTIFDKFAKGEDGNFGLGLSIAKTAVKMLGGEITARNDGGAVFEVKVQSDICPSKYR